MISNTFTLKVISLKQYFYGLVRSRIIPISLEAGLFSLIVFFVIFLLFDLGCKEALVLFVSSPQFFSSRLRVLIHGDHVRNYLVVGFIVLSIQGLDLCGHTLHGLLMNDILGWCKRHFYRFYLIVFNHWSIANLC